MSVSLWVLVLYLSFIWPTYLYTRRHYAYQCYADAMAFTWPLSVSFMILFEAWCFYQAFRRRNGPQLIVTKGCAPVIIPSNNADIEVLGASKDDRLSDKPGE